MYKKTEKNERCEKVGAYIAKTGCTIRQAAKKFCISKSTVHKDVTEVLPEEDKELAARVAEVLMKNKKERCVRGGIATKAKYAKMKAKE